MKNKIIKIALAIFILVGLVLPQIPFIQRSQVLAAEEETALPKEPSIPGRIEGSGTYFEIKNSEYLNLVLKSSEEVKVVLESIPKMISLDIEAFSTGTNSTTLTLEGLEPNKTYYKYQDSYKNLAVFVSDETGSYSWVQNLSQPRHIWIQEEKGTVFLPDQCEIYGIWDASSSICTLTQDLTESIEITQDNVTVNGNNHSVIGSGAGYGIYISQRKDITLENLNIKGFTYGVYLNHYPFQESNAVLTSNLITDNRYGLFVFHSSQNIFTNNVITSNSVNGIWITGGLSDYPWSPNNTLIGNNISNNGSGIYVTGSANNTITENTISNNRFEGIFLGSVRGSNNTLSRNTLSGNYWNFRISGGSDSAFENNIDTSNTVDGKPIYYLRGVNNQVYDNTTNAGLFYCIFCENVTVKNLTLVKNFDSIFFWRARDSKIENNAISENAIGISLYFSDNNILTNNIIYQNEFGIRLVGSNSNIFNKNDFSDNRTGIIFLQNSKNNEIYHNNFINNRKGGGIEIYLTGNLFDNGYPSGGNYWSNYTGVDVKKGPNQDQFGSDGIGDTPYTFYGGQDKYPLMKESGWEVPPIPIYNVAMILAEPANISHESAQITAQPCKLLPKKTYSDGHNKEYYQDLTYCVVDYYKENSFGKVNLNFEIYDDNGEWFKTSKNEEDYLNKEKEFVKDAIGLVINDGINLSNQEIVIVLHSGTSLQREKQKLSTQTWTPDDQPLVYPPYKIIVAEDDLVGGWTHEIGHILGALITPENTIIPDLSRHDIPMGDVEKWDLMARGSWNENGNNPPYMSSFTKEFLGWLNYDIYPKSAYGEYWINSLATSNYGDSVFRYNLSNDTNDESPKYYILEARNRNLKTWDSSLPGLPVVGDKNLVLYYVDTKGLPEYGYVPSGIEGYQEGMMWNQYRTITIPGNDSINDGILNPLINETYRDLDNLVKFSAITDRTVNDKYEIQTRIEEITYDSFSDNFWGVILRPKSTFKKWIERVFNPSFANDSELYKYEENSAKTQLAVSLPMPMAPNLTSITAVIQDIQPSNLKTWEGEPYLKLKIKILAIHPIIGSGFFKFVDGRSDIKNEVLDVFAKESEIINKSFKKGGKILTTIEVAGDPDLGGVIRNYTGTVHSVKFLYTLYFSIIFFGFFSIFLTSQFSKTLKEEKIEITKRIFKILKLLLLIILIIISIIILISISIYAVYKIDSFITILGIVVLLGFSCWVFKKYIYSYKPTKYAKLVKSILFILWGVLIIIFLLCLGLVIYFSFISTSYSGYPFLKTGDNLPENSNTVTIITDKDWGYYMRLDLFKGIRGLSSNLLILFVPLSLLLLVLERKLLSRWKPERKEKIVKIIFRIVWIFTLIIFLIFIIFSLATRYWESKKPTIKNFENFKTIANPFQIELTTFPDLDLHLYCDDGKHVGMNYETGEYEIQIPEIIASGDNQNSPEWIFIPKDITGCRFVVSSYDNQKFLEENPEVVQEMEDVTDSYDIYARYIDPNTSIYTSTIISENIEPGTELEHPISGTHDITIEPGILIARVDFDPNTFNLESKGQWVTVYFELPVGHGYDVSMIDSGSIMLNGQIGAEVKPTEIGDYDNDGIPDLMVKFNQLTVQNILQIGEKIKITIAGNLTDGRLFEGIDFIRAISL